MYPTISDFLREVLGLNIPLPIQSYGFFVATAFLIGIWIVVKEMKRKEAEGIFHVITKKVYVGAKATVKELTISGIFGFVVGFKLVDAFLRYSEFVASPQDFILSTDGSWLGGFAFAALSIFMSWYEKNKLKLEKPAWQEKKVRPHQLAGNILVVAGIFGLLGAKLFHNLENLDDLIAHPIESLFSFSGLTFFGGLIVGAVAVTIYVKRNKIPPIHVFDIGAVTMPLAYAIGRIGCQVSGDGCWGIDNLNPKPGWLSWLPDWAWAYNYPHNIINEGVLIPACDWTHCHVLANPVFPTPLYETAMMLIVFGMLFSIRKKIKVPGMLFSIYIIFAGIERFLIESIRINNVFKIGGLEVTQAEMISVGLVILGIIGIFITKKAHSRKSIVVE